MNEHYPLLFMQSSVEDEPLGTGGAIKKACELATEKNVLVINGDTLFSIDIKLLISFHLKHKAACTLSLKPMTNFNRYGVVELNTDNSIASFKEKPSVTRVTILAAKAALTISSPTAASNSVKSTIDALTRRALAPGNVFC